MPDHRSIRSASRCKLLPPLWIVFDEVSRGERSGGRCRSQHDRPLALRSRRRRRGSAGWTSPRPRRGYARSALPAAARDPRRCPPRHARGSVQTEKQTRPPAQSPAPGRPAGEERGARLAPNLDSQDARSRDLSADGSCGRARPGQDPPESGRSRCRVGPDPSSQYSTRLDRKVREPIVQCRVWAK